MSVGTRGDMEPFLALGEFFKNQGHDVICGFPEQFRDLAQETGLEFFSLGSKLIDLLQSKTGQQAMGGGGSKLKRIRAVIKLAQEQTPAQKELTFKQRELIERENPDCIIHNAKCIYPIIWAVNHPGQTVLVSPVPYLHYVKGHTHVAFNSNYGAWINKFTFWIAQVGLVTTTKISLQWLEVKNKISRRQVRSAVQSNKVIYTISPELFERPGNWPANMQVYGYQERSKTGWWEPGPELLQFLQCHQKILFLTFGSMMNPEPERKTQIVLQVVQKHRIPTIINLAAGGLIQPANFESELVHFVSRIPYDWIFPKMYAVAHHGGAGTTHLALKYGCASMIIPHIIDQFVWNKIIASKGAGPKGPKINGLTISKLETCLLALWNNEAYKKRATEISNQMQLENYKERIYKMVIE